MATAEQIARAREVARQRASGAINYSQTSPTTAPTTNRPPTTPSSGLGTTTTQANNTGLSQSVMDEIRRKAQAGIKLTNPNAASSALYNQYSQPSTTGQAMQPSQMNKPFTTGSNIIGYNPSNTIQNKIAELGSKWQTASPEERTAIAAQAQAIGQSAGGVFNPGTGTWVFPNQQGQTDGQQQYDPNMFSSANFIRERQRLAEEAARQQAYEASNLADAQSLQGGQRLQEVLAARGLGTSGENITATAQQQAARQGALTDIQNQLSGNIRDIGAQAQQQLLEDLYRSQDISRQQEQQDIQNALNEAQLTGQYLPPGARTAIDNIQRLKQLAESPGISADQRTALSREADKYRGQLASLNVDPRLFGANVTASMAGQNFGRAGIPTLAGRELDWSMSSENPAVQSQRISNEISKLQLQSLPAEIKSNLALLDQQVKSGAISIESAKYQLEQLKNPNSLVNQNQALSNRGQQLNQFLQIWESTGVAPAGGAQFGIQQGTPYGGQQSVSISQLNDLWKSSGVAPKGLESFGIQPGTPYGGTQSQNNAPDLSELGRYFDGVAQRDPDTGGITNPDQLENAILNSAVSDYDAYQLYNRYGLKWDGPVPSPN